MAVKSSNQISLIDLTDAYSVILTNEAHTFMGDTDSVSSTQTTTIQVMALCGAEQVACTVGTITGKTGLSAVSDGKSPSPTITITATSALTSGGTIDIPIQIGDITITKKFSYAIAFTGSKGSTGATGKGIQSTAVTYQKSTNGTTPPTSTWGTSIPTLNAGEFLWTRTVITYTDNTTSTSYSVGMKGATGNTGATGATGATGNGVSSATVTYAKGSSGTTAPTSNWSATIPSLNAGEYLWTKTVTTYTDGTTSTAYSVGMKGATGATGATGAAGADALTLVIESSNGIIFKNTSIATTLTAHIYKGGAEVTGSALTALGTIKWYKDGSTTPIGTGQTLTISAGDVTDRANYIAQLET